MKISKTLAFTILGAGALALAAVAAPRLDERLPELNAVVNEILTPFETAQTKASLSFLQLNSDDTNLLKVKATGFYGRVGKAQSLTVTVSELSHDNNAGAPLTALKGAATIDLSKLFPVEQIDGLVDGAEDMVKDIASNYTAAYGNAVTLDARVTEKVKGADGHYESFKAFLSVKIDLAKLPEGKKAEDIPFTDATLHLNATIASGIALQAQVVHNPSWKAFTADSNFNFKAALEKLLSRDESAKQKILGVLKKIDAMAATLVDANVSN